MRSRGDPRRARGRRHRRGSLRFAHLVALPGARVLDLACGQRPARALLRRARLPTCWPSTATPRRSRRSPGCARIETRALDLETRARPLAGERFDAIVVVNYLHRPLFPHLLAALADDGVLLYETFARGNEAFGRPPNPDFLLAPGELLQRLRGRLTVVAFEQGRVADGDGRRRRPAARRGRAGPHAGPSPLAVPTGAN